MKPNVLYETVVWKYDTCMIQPYKNCMIVCMYETLNIKGKIHTISPYGEKVCIGCRPVSYKGKKGNKWKKES